MTVDVVEPMEAVAATVREGDEICVCGWPELRVVSSVEIAGDGRVRIIYFARGEDAWVKGWHRSPWLVERTLRPFALDEPLLVLRGNPDRADELRLEMEYEREERWAAAAAKRELRSQRDSYPPMEGDSL